MTSTVYVRDHQLLDKTLVARGYTNRRLASEAEVSLGTVGGLRAGSRNGCTEKAARRICHTLGVSLDLIFMPHRHSQEP